MSFNERRQPLDLAPEMASLDCGSLNFGDGIFINDLPLMRKFAGEMAEKGIVPELECFEPGHVENALRLHRDGLLPGHLHFNLVFGVPGAMTYTPESLMFMKSLLPAGATWTATGIGRHQLPAAAQAMLAGGNVRVGFEDNVYYSKGIPADSNAQLVERVIRIAGELGRETATPDEARAMLGLPGREAT